MNKRSPDLQQQLEDAGFKGVVLSIGRLSELRSLYEKLINDSSLSGDFYNEIVSRYGLEWDFEPPTKLRSARSVIITAAQQPKISLEFQYDGRKFYGIIPPTYVQCTDEAVLSVISKHLHGSDYNVCNALLPTKLLAVCSGLAKYGRNNVTYIDGWGSYFRLKAFFSDVPCTEDQWREPRAMNLCMKCTTCVTKCPTGAISGERFLVDGAKCLTFFNEDTGDFPPWLDPIWHNCLIGCMLCQDACPVNKNHITWIMPGGEFSDEETGMILDGVSQERLSTETIEKLKKVDMMDSYEVLQRNLKALVDKSKKG